MNYNNVLGVTKVPLYEVLRPPSPLHILYNQADAVTEAPNSSWYSDSNSTSMVYSRFAASTVLFVVLLSLTAYGDTDICSQVTCGKGTCQSKPDYIPYGYICECDSGWKQTRLPDSKEQYLQFLPCTIPNCSIDYSCMPAPSPLPSVPINPYNVSIFNPCYWIYCGEGTCIKSSDNKHMCQCQTGAYNLLNISHFPCYGDCAIGSDCSKLGITKSLETNSGSSPSQTLGSSPSSASNDGNFSRKLSWMISAMISMAVISRQ